MQEAHRLRISFNRDTRDHALGGGFDPLDPQLIHQGTIAQRRVQFNHPPRLSGLGRTLMRLLDAGNVTLGSNPPESVSVVLPVSKDR